MSKMTDDYRAARKETARLMDALEDHIYINGKQLLGLDIVYKQQQINEALKAAIEIARPR